MKRRGIRATVSILGLSLLIASFFHSPAEAILMELEPDVFRVGTNVTNIFEGVTLYRVSSYSAASSSNLYGASPSFISTPIYSSVFIEDDSRWWGAATGTHTFGSFRNPSYAPAQAVVLGSGVFSDCPSSGSCRSSFSALMVQFSRPTNYFEIAGSWQSDHPELFAYDQNGQGVAGPSENSWRLMDNSPYYHYAETSRSSTGDIATIFQIGSLDRSPYIQTIFIGGWENPATLDRIRFNNVRSMGVPEPSSLLLLGIGLAGLVVWRWRQTAETGSVSDHH